MREPNEDEEPNSNSEKRLSRFSIARFAFISQFTGEIVVFLLIGLWIDHQWQVAPWGVIVGAVLGMTVAMYHLIRNVNKTGD